MICDNDEIKIECHFWDKSTEHGITDLQTNMKLKYQKYEWVDLVVAAAPLTFTTHKGGRQLAELAAAIFICYLLNIYLGIC